MNSQDTIVSVVIPCLNEADTIGPLLESLQWLRSNGGEVIVVDGGSGDDTFDQAVLCADKVIHSPPGRAIQMNAGAHEAEGQWLWFVHADSRLDTSLCRYLIQELGDMQESWGRFDVQLSGEQWTLRLIETLMNWRSRMSGIATGDQGIFVRRTLFDSIAGYPDIPLMEDVELSKRLKRHSRHRCLEGPLVTSSRRWEAKGVWRTVLLMWWLRLLYFMGVPAKRLAEQYHG